MLKADSARSTRRAVTVGIILWTATLAAVAAQKAPFGIIELFFLFVPLVIVPLGLELGAVVAPVRFAWTLNWARVLQPASAMMVVAAFCLPPGWRAGALILPWLMVCFLVALGGLSSLLNDSRSLGAIAVNISRVDLLVAGTWLLLSRLGIQPLGFREPIVLLTAVHFHYTGFATALLAGAMLEFARRHDRDSRACSAVVAVVISLPFVLAAGFVFSPALKVFAAVVLSAGLVGLAVAQLWVGRVVPRSSGGMFLWISSGAVAVAMTLAGIYAIGEFLGKDWLPVPLMAATHGLLNSLGFALPGLVGWLLTWAGAKQPSKVPATRFNKAATVWFLQD